MLIPTNYISMKIILSKNCESLTGSIGRGFGYHIQRRHDRQGHTQFYGVRQSNGSVPKDGHWRFVVACAELAKIGLHIRDIEVKTEEINNAIWEARWLGPVIRGRKKKVYNAADILQLKERLGL